MTRPPRNIAASVRDRLLKIAQARGDDFQLVLVRYANERLLARLAASPHASDFVLKGATLFAAWTGSPHRATQEFGEDADKNRQWIAFGRKAGVRDLRALADTLVSVAQLAEPVFAAARVDETWLASWKPGGPWLIGE